MANFIVKFQACSISVTMHTFVTNRHTNPNDYILIVYIRIGLMLELIAIE